MDNDTYAALLQRVTALEAKYMHPGVAGGSALEAQRAIHQTQRAQLHTLRAQRQRLDALIAALGLPPPEDE